MSKEKLRENLRLKLKSRPFNSALMRQLSFDFHDGSIFESPEETEIARQAFAKKYFDMKCGYLHLGWDIDEYWSLVANRIMIPYVLAIYNELVSKGFNEQNTLMYGDADGDVFWLPAKNSNTKVFVHTNQCRDYIYILTEFPSHKKSVKPRYEFHIRRLWRNWNSLSEYEKSMLEDLYLGVPKDTNSLSETLQISKEEFIKTILQNVNSIEEIADDHYQYSKRHSLEYYRERGFVMRDLSEPFNGIYGDARDGGYVFSMDYWGRTEHTCSKFSLLELISSCYLPNIAEQLKLKLDNEWLINNS